MKETDTSLDKQDQQDQIDTIPRKSFIELVPTGSLIRAVLLLALLAGVVWFQGRSAAIADFLSKAMYPPPPPRPARVVRQAVAIPPALARPPEPATVPSESKP